MSASWLFLELKFTQKTVSQNVTIDPWEIKDLKLIDQRHTLYQTT